MSFIKVAGNIAASALSSRVLSTNNPITTLPDVIVTAPRVRSSEFTTQNLAYPINVEGDPQQGHYISFYIRVTEPGKLKAAKEARAELKKLEKSIAKEYKQEQALDIFGGGGRTKEQVRQSRIKEFGVERYKAAQEDAAIGTDQKSNSVRLQKTPTRRLTTAISLYMPPSVQVEYNSKYGEQEIGILAETGYEALKDYQAGTDTKEAIMKGLAGAEQGIKKLALAAIETAAPGAKALFALEHGKVITPKMELMFEGIGRRGFSYSFVFIPKSEKEAQVVKDIVYQFKYHMAANYAGGGASGQREMKIPSMFDIEYMYLGKQNSNLNKISTCVLKTMSVEYGGDRYVAYEGGVPQTTKISLTFEEMELITKDKIAEGF